MLAGPRCGLTIALLVEGQHLRVLRGLLIADVRSCEAPLMLAVTHLGGDLHIDLCVDVALVRASLICDLSLVRCKACKVRPHTTRQFVDFRALQVFALLWQIATD